MPRGAKGEKRPRDLNQWAKRMVISPLARSRIASRRLGNREKTSLQSALDGTAD